MKHLTVQGSPKELLVIQAIQIRWNRFYDLLVKLGTNLTNELKKYLDLSNEDRTKKLESEDKDKDLDSNIRLKLRDFKSHTDLWEFVKQHHNILFTHTRFYTISESSRIY